MRWLFLLLVYCPLSFPVNGQPLDVPRFRIVQIPYVITSAMPDIKHALNKQLARVQNKTEAFAVLNDALRNFKNAEVKLREQTGTTAFQYYSYNISAPGAASLVLVDIKGSRGKPDFINNTADLLAFFPDSTVILDTLKLYFNAKNFSPEANYFIAAGKKPLTSIPLHPATSQPVFITENHFDTSAGNFIACRLIDKADGKNIRAFFKLRFLGEKEKEELRSVAAALKDDAMEGTGQVNHFVVANHLSAYISARFGKVKYGNLTDWIKKEL